MKTINKRMVNHLYRVSHSYLHSVEKVWVRTTPTYITSSGESSADVELIYRRMKDLGKKPDLKLIVELTTLDQEEKLVKREVQPEVPLGLALIELKNFIEAVRAVVYWGVDAKGCPVMTESQGAKRIAALTHWIYENC
jgi:hypothetical protein